MSMSTAEVVRAMYSRAVQSLTRNSVRWCDNCARMIEAIFT